MEANSSNEKPKKSRRRRDRSWNGKRVKPDGDNTTVRRSERIRARREKSLLQKLLEEIDRKREEQKKKEHANGPRSPDSTTPEIQGLVPSVDPPHLELPPSPKNHEVAMDLPKLEPERASSSLHHGNAQQEQATVAMPGAGILRRSDGHSSNEKNNGMKIKKAVRFAVSADMNRNGVASVAGQHIHASRASHLLPNMVGRNGGGSSATRPDAVTVVSSTTVESNKSTSKQARMPPRVGTITPTLTSREAASKPGEELGVGGFALASRECTNNMHTSRQSPVTSTSVGDWEVGTSGSHLGSSQLLGNAVAGANANASSQVIKQGFGKPDLNGNRTVVGFGVGPIRHVVGSVVSPFNIVDQANNAANGSQQGGNSYTDMSNLNRNTGANCALVGPGSNETLSRPYETRAGPNVRESLGVGKIEDGRKNLIGSIQGFHAEGSEQSPDIPRFLGMIVNLGEVFPPQPTGRGLPELQFNDGSLTAPQRMHSEHQVPVTTSRMNNSGMSIQQPYLNAQVPSTALVMNNYSPRIQRSYLSHHVPLQVPPTGLAMNNYIAPALNGCVEVGQLNTRNLAPIADPVVNSTMDQQDAAAKLQPRAQAAGDQNNSILFRILNSGKGNGTQTPNDQMN